MTGDTNRWRGMFRVAVVVLVLGSVWGTIGGSAGQWGSALRGSRTAQGCSPA